MHLVIYALVEASTEEDVLSVGRTVFDRFVSADPNAGAVLVYYVCFDETNPTVADRVEWDEFPVASPVDPDDGQELLDGG